jgi:hypothetical protein
MNEFADISFGDAWIKNYKNHDNIGRSVIITRNKKADEIIRSAKIFNEINLKNENINEIKKSFKDKLITKKDLGSYINSNKIIDRKLPEYDNLQILNLNRKNSINLALFSRKLSSKKWIWPYLKYITFLIYIIIIKLRKIENSKINIEKLKWYKYKP